LILLRQPSASNAYALAREAIGRSSLAAELVVLQLTHEAPERSQAPERAPQRALGHLGLEFEGRARAGATKRAQRSYHALLGGRRAIEPRARAARIRAAVARPAAVAAGRGSFGRGKTRLVLIAPALDSSRCLDPSR
jgi:hypothetical protein